MFKKFLAVILTVAMIAAMWIVPASAADVVLDVDYGDKAWLGKSAVAADTLPIPKGYDGNFTLELYVKINDFATASVIAGAFPDGGATPYAVWVNGGTLWFSAGDTNGNNHVKLGSAYTADWAGKWLHVVGVKNGTTNTLYVCPEGSSEYVTASAARTYAVVWSDATEFKINCATTLFNGTGDFSLGTVRMYNADVSANRLTMKAECEARLKAATGGEPTPAPKDKASLIISSKPSKLVYEIGEEFSAEGMKLLAPIDGVKEPVNLADCEFYGFSSERAGKYKITVKYETENTVYTNQFAVKINAAATVSAIGLVTKPSQLYYVYGKALNTEGLAVLAKYTDGTTAIVREGLKINGYNANKAGLQRVTVSYQGHYTAFSVRVAEKGASVQAPYEEITESRSLLSNLYFTNGFRVRDLGGDQGTTDFIGTFPGNINAENATWILAQWTARYSFMDETVSTQWQPSEGVYFVSSPNEVFGVDTNTGLVTFQCNASRCYDTPRTASDPWMHLLIEDYFKKDDWGKVSEIKHLSFSVDTQLTKFEDHMDGAADPGRHSAQFSTGLHIQNLNKDSADYGKVFWLSIPLFDNRTENIAPYNNLDKGTNSMVFGLPSSDTCVGTYRYTKDGVIQAGTDTPWVSYYRDVIDDIKTAFANIQGQGYFADSTLDDMYIAGIDMGWEVPGTYDVEMLIKNLDVVAER